MSGLIDKRKRSREDDVSCESTPLSKRINNLHLSNSEEAQYNNQQQAPHHHNNNNHIPQHVAKDMLLHHHATSASTSSKSMNGEADNSLYHPELNESENPFYYDKNKLLHDLHLERLKRCTV